MSDLVGEIKGVVKSVSDSYRQTATKQTLLVDCFLIYVAAIAVLQVSPP
jgi:hypothetical protein